MARPRYRSYRGTHSKRPILLAIALTLLLALGYGVYWVAEHISMNADGTIRVNLPQFISPAPSPSDPSPSPLNIVVVSPSPTLPPETDEPSPTPTPTPTPPPMRAVFVPQETMSDATRLAQLKTDAETLGINTMVLDCKSDEGVVAATEVLNAVRDSLGEGFRYVARISVFLDNTMTRQRNAWAVKHTNGLNWLNAGGRWLNPFSEPAREYCAGVIADIGAMGFDAILLDHVCFPWNGQLNKLTYGENNERSHEEAIDTFLTQLDELSMDCPMYVTVLYETVTTGEQGVAGQRLETLQERFDGVFVLWADPLETLDSAITPILVDAPTEALNEKLGDLTRAYMLTRPDGVYR